MKTADVRSLLLWIFLLIFSCPVFSQEPQKYIPFRKGKLWGLCDADKFVTVQPQYNSISWYDASAGGFHVEQNGKFGIIDNNSVPVMPCISDQPIFINGDQYVVFNGFNYYNYSRKTKMRLGEYNMPESFHVNDRWRKDDPFFSKDEGPASLTWNDLDDEDLDMIMPYDDEKVYQINFKTSFLEIVSKDSHIGIYIPEIKKLYKSTPEVAYIGWQYYTGKPYVLTTDSSGLFGLADEFSRTVYPVRYASITLSEAYHLVFLSEPDPQDPENLIVKTILPNNIILNGRFEPLERVWRKGHQYQLYYTMINGEKNYAGEDGTLYFEG